MLADYAQNMTGQCTVRAVLPDSFNNTTYESTNIVTSYISSQASVSVSVSDMIEYMYGQTGTNYKMVRTIKHFNYFILENNDYCYRQLSLGIAQSSAILWY